MRLGESSERCINSMIPVRNYTDLVFDWHSISYRFDGKAISATSKTPKFSRVAEKAGVFEITDVAHQQASCQSEVTNMRFTIRDLPSARVSHGNIVYEDLREGQLAQRPPIRRLFFSYLLMINYLQPF